MAENPESWQALHEALEQNHVTEVRRLLSLGADVNVRSDNDWTPLHTAVKNSSRGSHFLIMKLLLENGADANAQYAGGDTALHRLAEGYAHSRYENDSITFGLQSQR